MACTRSGPTASRSSSRRSHRPRPSQVRKTWRGRAAPPPRPLGCIDIPPAHHLEPVETTTISPSPPPVVARPLAAVRRYVGRWGLIAALAALPIYYGIDDLTHGYQAGFVAGAAGLQLRRRPVQRRDLGVDRDRVHPRLRHHRADQLRSR